MTVDELIGLLQECDPEAEVRIMSQEGWPFENGIGEPHAEGCAAEDDGEYADGLAGNDVFIVEGEQQRYGSKDAWAVAHR